MTLYVSYKRVSTARQGVDGLGIAAQNHAVHSFCEPLEEFVEVESGRKNDRPQLKMAIAACKRLGATLVVARLDRLARNVHFLSGLMESGIEFVCLDNPNANRLTLHVLAAVAEYEARCISERTKAALAAYKARGGRLGKPNLTPADQRRGTNANIVAAKVHNAQPKEIAASLRLKGYTLTAIAETLTGRGILTRRNKAWTPTAVMRILA
jgi:DNA invertase Pin-like site-specific DNA recombinase